MLCHDMMWPRLTRICSMLPTQVANLKAENDELKAAEQELYQASRQLEEIQGGAGEEVRRLREENKEAIDKIRRENEELVHALGGMRRQRDDALEVAQVSPCARVPRIHTA
jgi:DNA anti-recombination protein RmuC